MKPKLIYLPYKPDAMLNYFSKVSDQPWSMLLHSGNSKYYNSRYDILVTDPIITITTSNGITEVYNNGKLKSLKDDPLSIVQYNIKESNNLLVQPSLNLPFQGGAVGFFSYDFIRNFEVLPKKSKNDLPFPEMAIGIYRWTIIADHHLKIIVLLSYDDPKPLIDKINIENNFHLQKRKFNLLSKWNSNMTFYEYKKKFQKIQQHLLNGDCYQVCLAQRFNSIYEGDEWSMFVDLLSYNKSPFSAFIRLNNQVIMSFSPERFIYLNKKNIETNPIKGTLPRLSNTFDDLKQIKRLSNSVKDQIENVMIVDLLRNDLGKVSRPGTVKVHNLFSIKTFTKVHHMVSTIKAVLLDNYTPCDLIRACFPGGSITGVPKIRAMEIIENLEPHRRSVWCGSIGYISYCDTMNINIAIRTLLLTNHHIYCSVGSAIIADSEEEKEYQETIDKAKSLLFFP